MTYKLLHRRLWATLLTLSLVLTPAALRAQDDGATTPDLPPLPGAVVPLTGAADPPAPAAEMAAPLPILPAAEATPEWAPAADSLVAPEAAAPAAGEEATSITWNTFGGGSGSDEAFGGAVDSSGNVYVVGASSGAWGTPVRGYSGGTDAVVAKFNSSGALVWHTFLGAAQDDAAYDLAVDNNGRVYVTGYSAGTWGSPVRPYTAAYDIFVARLNSSGALEWATFLGGSDSDRGVGLALYGTDIFIAGVSRASWGSAVNQHAGYDDILVAKLNNSGALQWHTFHGSGAYEEATDILVNSAGHVYVSGYSDMAWGTVGHAFNGGRDAVVLRLSSGGAYVWNSFVGGAGQDHGFALAANGLSGVILGGSSDATWANNPYNRFNGARDGFIAGVSAQGTIPWNTFLGSPYADEVRSLATDSSGNIFYAAVSNSTWGAPVDPFAGGADVVVGKLNSSGHMQWNSFFGSNYNDRAAGVAALSNGRVAVMGESEATWGAPVRGYSGSKDLFAALLPNYGTRVGQNIPYRQLPWRTVGDPPFTLTFTATSGLPVTYMASGVCTVQGATVFLTGAAGSCQLVANQEGSQIFAPAIDLATGFQVVKANQAITFPQPADKTYGDAPFAVNPTASSGLPVTLTSSTPGVCTVAATTVTLTAAGACTLTANQAGDAGYNPAAPVIRTFTIAKASQTINFAAPANKTYGDAPFAINPTATSGLPVSVASNTPAVCTIAGNTVSIVAAGACTLVASQGGNSNYLAAANVSRTFTVAKANQTISFGALANRPLGSPPFTVNASATSGLAVTFAGTTPAVCTVNGSTVTLVTQGVCTIRAQQGGNANYNAAPAVNRSFTVLSAGSGFKVFLPFVDR